MSCIVGVLFSIAALHPGIKRAVDTHKCLGGHLKVAVSGRRIPMAKELLDENLADAIFKQVNRERMPQRMWRDIFRQPEFHHLPFHILLNGGGR